MHKYFSIFLLLFIFGCRSKKYIPVVNHYSTFLWENATVYFLLTDRFNNGDKTNDFVHPNIPAPYRGYMGGDIKGITEKINSGYFEKLGVDALWMTPLIENISLGVDEGSGLSYGFHGYWTKDWTKIDSRLGTEQDVKDMVSAAHKKGIRILMDAVINHIGPVTTNDIKWPDDWVRTGPKCTYKSYESTITCTLVDNLPDIKTESKEEVALPQHLITKWKSEGRHQKEVDELEAFFARTGYPRRPYYYIIKWLTDLIRKFGIDGFRVDTVKHTEEDVWKTLYEESQNAFNDWKKQNPGEVLDDKDFFMVGEVYNYYIGSGRNFDFGDRKVDYFNHGFHSLINFDFKYDAKKPYHELFNKYDDLLHGPLAGKSVMNYISSHDDGSPFDKLRNNTFESATRLLLTQGIAQIYYGDESARSLSVNASGDATLRSFMNWDEHSDPEKSELLLHWQKLGRFRKNHPAVGAGRHHQIKDNLFARTFRSQSTSDVIVCALEQKKGLKEIFLSGYFDEGDILTDYYSGKKVKVTNNHIMLDSPFEIVLLSK